MAQHVPSLDTLFTLPRVRQVAISQIGRWLAGGWRGMRRAPIASLSYGLLFAIAGDLLLVSLWQRPQYFLIAVSGFFIVAPLLSAGLFELSRRGERGLDSRFIDSLAAFARGREGLALFGMLLVLLAIAWERFSAILFATLLAGATPANIGDFFSLAGGDALIVVWFAVGALLALLVFMLSVVSVPLLIDRDSDFISASATSLRAFIANPLPLLAWAATITLLTLAGFATLLFGLIVVMPLLGHASWHAYRDLVE